MKRDSGDHQTVTRGLEAAQVLTNQAYIDAMEQLRADVIAGWKDCPIRDAEGQRLFLQLAKVTEKFEATLRGYVEGGRYAEHKIKMDEMRNEPAARKLLRKVI